MQSKDVHFVGVFLGAELDPGDHAYAVALRSSARFGYAVDCVMISERDRDETNAPRCGHYGGWRKQAV
jgi:hypothetical protein